MTNPRKDARPSYRSAAAAGPLSTSTPSSGSWRAGLLAATVVLVLVAGWRWHTARVTAPLRVSGVETPTAVLVVQEGDCPDRRDALEGWLAERGAAGVDGPTIRLAALDDRAVAAGSSLAATPALERAGTRQAARALIRFGVEGTPALLLLDAAGLPVLGAAFATDGPGSRFDLALRLLEDPPDRTVPRAFETPAGGGNTWNP